MTRYCLKPKLHSAPKRRRIRTPRQVTPLCVCRTCSMARHPSAGGNLGA